MKTVKIIILRSGVLGEVAKATAYAGVKTTGDVAADFDRIATVESDSDLLSRFWTEAAVVITTRFREFIVNADYSGAELNLTLSLSSSYDESQTPALSSALYSYMVRAITAKWYAFTLKGEAPQEAAAAETLLADAAARCYWRRPPRRR